jgi:hypothetical protein
MPSSFESFWDVQAIYAHRDPSQKAWVNGAPEVNLSPSYALGVSRGRGYHALPFACPIDCGSIEHVVQMPWGFPPHARNGGRVGQVNYRVVAIFGSPKIRSISRARFSFGTVTASLGATPFETDSRL